MIEIKEENKLTEEIYKKLRIKIIDLMEDAKFLPYYDGAIPNKLPTIGLGFNIAEEDIRNLVFDALGIGVADNIPPGQEAQEAVYRQQLEDILKGAPLATKEDLRKASRLG